MEGSKQRTFTKSIPCTCSAVYCDRYHGLPEYQSNTLSEKDRKLFADMDALWELHLKGGSVGIEASERWGVMLREALQPCYSGSW